MTHQYLPEIAVLFEKYLRVATSDQTVFARVVDQSIMIGMTSGSGREHNAFNVFAPDSQDQNWRLFQIVKSDRGQLNSELVTTDLKLFLLKMVDFFYVYRLTAAQALFDFELDALLNNGSDRALK